METRADNLKVLVFGMLMLGAAAYVGLKLYIYTSVKDVIDQALSRVTTSGRIEYGGISSSLTSGAVSIDDIVIAPPGMSEEIRIKSAKIGGPGLHFLLKRRTLPRQWTSAQSTPMPSETSLPCWGSPWRSTVIP